MHIIQNLISNQLYNNQRGQNETDHNCILIHSKEIINLQCNIFIQYACFKHNESIHVSTSSSWSSHNTQDMQH